MDQPFTLCRGQFFLEAADGRRTEPVHGMVYTETHGTSQISAYFIPDHGGKSETFPLPSGTWMMVFADERGIPLVRGKCYTSFNDDSKFTVTY